MPATVKKIKGKYRVIDADTGRPMRNQAGTSVDGGGHDAEAHAKRQARAINASLSKEGKI